MPRILDAFEVDASTTLIQADTNTLGSSASHLLFSDRATSQSFLGVRKNTSGNIAFDTYNGSIWQQTLLINPVTPTVTIAADLVVSGNFTVNGTTSVINTTDLNVSDRVIRANWSDGTNVPTPTLPVGIAVERGDVSGVKRDRAGVTWDEGTTRIRMSYLTGATDSAWGTDLDIQAGTGYFSTIQISGLSPSQYVVTDGSSNLTSQSGVPWSDISSIPTIISTFSVLADSAGYLYNDGAGNLTWGYPTTAPGGADTQVQYNSSGSFAGSADFTWNNGLVVTGTEVGGPQGVSRGIDIVATGVSNTTDWIEGVRISLNTDHGVTGGYTGLHIQDLASVGAAGGNAIGLYIESIVAGSNNYAIYTNNAGLIYFGDVTQATTLSSASVVVMGGVSVNKSLRIGDTLVFHGSTSGSIGIKAAAVAGTPTTLTLPTTNGSSGYVLSTNGSGVLSWIAPTTGTVTGSGAVNEIAYWDSSSNITSSSSYTLVTSVNGPTLSLGDGGKACVVNLYTDGSSVGGSNVGFYVYNGVATNQAWFLGFPEQRTGSNAGMNFVIKAYTDAGALIDSPFRIDRVLTGSITMSRKVSIGAVGGATGTLTLLGSTSGSATIKVAAAAGSPADLVLPTTSGTSGYVLSTDGAGNLSWVAQSTGTISGSGTATQITYWTGSSAISGNNGLVVDATNRRIGISDSSSLFSPLATLHLSKDTNTGMRADTYSNTAAAVAGVQLYKARGTAASPAAVQSGDSLGFIAAYGYYDGGTPAFSSTSRAKIEFLASENWTSSTVNGAYITVGTTADGSATLTERIRFYADGGVKLSGTSGTFTTSPGNGVLSITQNQELAPAAGTVLQLIGSNNINTQLEMAAFGTTAHPHLIGRRARANPVNPGAVQTGDVLLEVSGSGHDGTAWSTATPGMTLVVAENWAVGAQGTYLYFSTTPNGTTSATEKLRIYGDGGVQVGGTYGTSPGAGEVSAAALVVRDGGTYTTTIQAGTQAANLTLTLPTTAGTSGYVLSTDGAGNLSWISNTAGSITGSGVANQVTYWTGSSVISGDNSFTFTPTTGVAIAPTAVTSGTQRALLITGAANTGITLSTEVSDVYFNLNRTVQWATGALTTQRAVRIDAPTYAFVGASTITSAATFAVSGAPAAGTNATITNAYAIWSQAGLNLFAGDTIVGSNPTAPSTARNLRVSGTAQFGNYLSNNSPYNNLGASGVNATIAAYMTNGANNSVTAILGVCEGTSNTTLKTGIAGVGRRTSNNVSRHVGVWGMIDNTNNSDPIYLIGVVGTDTTGGPADATAASVGVFARAAQTTRTTFANTALVVSATSAGTGATRGVLTTADVAASWGGTTLVGESITVTMAGTNAQSSTTATTVRGIDLSMTVNQGSTLGYTGILANVVETATGSGNRHLLELQTSSVPNFIVDRAGTVYLGSTATRANMSTISISATAGGLQPVFTVGMTSFWTPSGNYQGFQFTTDGAASTWAGTVAGGVGAILGAVNSTGSKPWVGSSTVATTSYVVAMKGQLAVNPGTLNGAVYMAGGYFDVSNTASNAGLGTNGYLAGVVGAPTYTTTLTTGTGVAGVYGFIAAPSVVNNAASGSVTVPSVTGYLVAPGTVSTATGATTIITNWYGLYLGDVTTSGAGTTTITNKYGIYQVGAGLNVLSGATSITASTASTSSSTGALVVTGGLGVGGAVYAANLASSALTSGRVTYSTTGGLLTDNANLTYNGTTLGITGLLNISRTSTSGIAPIVVSLTATAGSATGQSTTVATSASSPGAALVYGQYVSTSLDSANLTSGSSYAYYGLSSHTAAVGATSYGYYHRTAFSANLGTAYGVYVDAYGATGSTTLTNWYGLYVAAAALSGGAAITNRYGIYQADTAALNVFASTVASTSTTTGALIVSGGVGIAKELYVGTRTGTAVNYAGFDANGKLIETAISISNPVSGTGAANSVAYWSGTNTLTSSGQFLYSSNILYVSGATSLPTTFFSANRQVRMLGVVGNPSGAEIYCATNTATSSSSMSFLRARTQGGGTWADADLAAVQTKDYLCSFSGSGWNGTDWSGNAVRGAFRIIAAENFTSTNRGTSAHIATTQTGTSGSTLAHFYFSPNGGMYIGADVYTTIPTDPGVGSLVLEGALTVGTRTGTATTHAGFDTNGKLIDTGLSVTNNVTGTGSNGYLTYWSGTSTMTGEASLFWDATNKVLDIGNGAGGATYGSIRTNKTYTGTTSFNGNYFLTAFAPASAITGQTIYGHRTYFTNTTATAGNLDAASAFVGQDNTVYLQSTGAATLSTLYGSIIGVAPVHGGSSGTLSLANMYGQFINPQAYSQTSGGTTTVSGMYGLFLRPTISTVVGSTTTVTYWYGLYVDQASISGGGSGSITNQYPIYQASTTGSNYFGADSQFVGKLALGGLSVSSTTFLNLAAGTTGVSSLRIAHGSAPTSPVNGDLWTTTAGAYARINGTTYRLDNQGSLTQHMFLEAPTNKTYVIIQRAATSGTIRSLAAKTSSGTLTANVQINGVSVTSLSSVAVTSTPGTTSATGANTIAAGDLVTIIVTSASAPVDFSFSLEIDGG